MLLLNFKSGSIIWLLAKYHLLLHDTTTPEVGVDANLRTEIQIRLPLPFALRLWLRFFQLITLWYSHSSITEVYNKLPDNQRLSNLKARYSKARQRSCKHWGLRGETERLEGGIKFGSLWPYNDFQIRRYSGPYRTSPFYWEWKTNLTLCTNSWNCEFHSMALAWPASVELSKRISPNLSKILNTFCYWYFKVLPGV